MVQHLEGGIVAKILIKDGDLVEKDQLLMVLEEAAALGELEQLRAREAGLHLRAERLRAFVLDTEPDLSRGTEFPDLARDQVAILDMQRRTRDSQREVMLSRVEQRQAEIDALREQRASLERQVSIIKEEVGMRRQLLEKGLVSKVIYLETERNLSKTRGDLAAIAGELARAQEARAEAEVSLAELDSRLRNEALDEMGTVTAELAQVSQLLRKLEDRVDRLEITAPADGIVKGLSTRTIGGVIQPGAILMEIVPLDDVMVAEVQISPRDIGHLQIGQESEVRISTFDAIRFGTIPGRLTRLSASTFEDENGEPYYKAVIALEKNFVGNEPGRYLVLPGMVVDASINTGGKTLLEYLLKPVYRSFNSAFRER